MILSVTFEKTTYNQLPWKFEAGTPNIAGVIGLGAAIRYLEAIGMERIAAYEQELLEYATARLDVVPGLRIVGTAPHKAAVVSFTLDGIHPHDIGTILDTEGVADPHRPSLRHAGDGLLQDPGDGARLVVVLQHVRGDRSTRRCARTHAQVLG